MQYRVAKGVFDILPSDPDPEGRWRESHLWQYLEKIIRELAIQFGFREIRTPLSRLPSFLPEALGRGPILSQKKCTPSWTRLTVPSPSGRKGLRQRCGPLSKKDRPTGPYPQVFLYLPHVSLRKEPSRPLPAAPPVWC